MDMGALQALRQHGVRRVDERLDQLHLHRSGSRACGIGHGAVFAQHVLDDFVQHFRLHRLLHEVPGARAAAPPRCSPDSRRKTP